MSGCEVASHCDSISISLKIMTLSIFPRPYWLFAYILWRNIYPNNLPVYKLAYAVMSFSMVFSHMYIIILCSYSPPLDHPYIPSCWFPYPSHLLFSCCMYYIIATFPLFLQLKNFFSPLNYTYTHKSRVHIKNMCICLSESALLNIISSGCIHFSTNIMISFFIMEK